MTIASFLVLLAFMALTILMVWAGVTVYFRRRDRLFWAYAEELANEPTEAERAAYEQYDAPQVQGLLAQIEAATYDKPIISTEDFLDNLMDEELGIEPASLYAAAMSSGKTERLVFTSEQIDTALADVASELKELLKSEPEGDPAAKTPEPSKTEEELDRAATEKAAAERAARDEIPVGVAFTGEDGNRYKYVRHPVTGARTKLKVTSAVGNPNAVPMPRGAEMSRISMHQAVDSVHGQAMDSYINLYEETVSPCELCDLKEQHSHTSKELAVFIRERTESSFKKHVEEMDLTKLPIGDVEKLWARCKARIQQSATLREMTRLEGIWDTVVNFDEEDETFFQDVVKQASAGPIALDKLERSPAPNYAKAEEGPWTGKVRGETCGNCEDLSVQDMMESPENCGCPTYFDESEQAPYRGGPVKNPDAQPMPKRYMSGISRQDATDSVWDSLNAFATELAEQVVEEDERNKVFGATAELVKRYVNGEVPSESEAAAAQLRDARVAPLDAKVAARILGYGPKKTKPKKKAPSKAKPRKKSKKK